VWAAPPRTPQAEKERAEKAYEAALVLYRKGQYRAAIDKLEEARAIDPQAKELPYNLGLVHEKLGELDDAIKWFELYLTLEPDESERERVKGTLRRLEGARRDLRPAPSATASAAPPPPPPPSASSDERPAPRPPPPGGRLDGYVYAAGGVAVATLAAGTFFGVRALSLRPSNPTTGSGRTIGDLQSSADDAHRSAIVADLCLGLAAVSGAAAAWLYFGRSPDAPPPPEVAIVPTGDGMRATLRMRF
jgi:tetratricopeptide (TPR) repeat protein